MTTTALNLAGRVARCYCGAERPSSEALAFFEFCGEGSRWATEMCVCGYGRVAHEQPQQFSRTGSITVHNVVIEGKCAGFKPRGPLDHDRFYDGCSGWE